MIRTNTALPLIAFWAIACAPNLRAQQPPANLNFELREAGGRPTGWSVGGNGFQMVVDSVAPFAGSFSLRSKWISTDPWVESARSFGVASAAYPPALARGRKLLLTGYVRTDDITAGYAGFWMRVDGGGRVLHLDNMSGRGVRGTTAWTRYEIELPVDSGATAVTVGVIHPGNGTAWFDSLALHVVGEPMPRQVPDGMPLRPATAPASAFRPVPRPAEDMARLLSDAELALAPDTVAPPAENADWTTWIRANAHPIRSLGATDFSDLRFFAPLLAGKRIVQLGESGHGVAEFNLAKVRLIKYLHAELGYDVIAFESSVFECDRAQRASATLPADQLMRNCIFGVWHTAEVLQLFEYIKQTHSTPRPLILAGFDEQTSSASVFARPAFFFDVIATIDTAYAREVARRDSVYLTAFRSSDRSMVQRDRDRIVAFYDSVATWIRPREARLASLLPDDPKAPIIARQTAISMTAYTHQIAATGSAGTSIRDRGMADNLDVLLDELYPQKKVMVWAHNFHIQHRQHVVTGDTGTGIKPKTMGVWVAERRRHELYTMGLFMYRGAAAMNNRQPYPVARMQAGSLESILHHAPWRYSYVDLSAATHTAGTSWMFQRIMTMEWGVNRDPLVPRDEYDGILFIDTTHPPQYIASPRPPGGS